MVVHLDWLQGSLLHSVSLGVCPCQRVLCGEYRRIFVVKHHNLFLA